MSYGDLDPEDLAPLFPGEPVFFDFFSGTDLLRIGSYVCVNPLTQKFATVFNCPIDYMTPQVYLSEVFYWQDVVIQDIRDRNPKLRSFLPVE